MKKIAILTLAIMLSCLSVNAFAEEASTTQKDALDWSISMMPEQSAEEKEEARWSVLVENEIGINAYDMESIAYLTDANGAVDQNLMRIVTRTVYAPKTKELQKKIAGMYKDKLSKKEKLQSSNMEMVFNISERTYFVQSMDVYSNKNTLLEHKENPIIFKPIPAGSIAEALYDICVAAAHPEEAATLNKK